MRGQAFRRAIFSMAAALAVTGWAWAATVTALKLSVEGIDTRVTLEADGDVTYRASQLTDPYRVVVDFDETGWNLPADLAKDGQGAIQSLRYGAYKKGVSRLVLDLRQAASVKYSFSQKDAATGVTQIVFVLQTVTRDKFIADAQALRKRGVQTTPPPIDIRPILEAKIKPAPAPAPSEPPKQVAQAKPDEVPLEKALATPPATTPAPQPPVRYVGPKKIVVLDPGHGGVDPGTHGANGSWEKDVVLAIAQKVRDKLEATGRYKVVMTRDSDIFIPLRGRIDISRNAKADLFISIHADSIKNPAIQGATVYTLSEKASDREAELLARQENSVDLIAGMPLPSVDQDVAQILIDLTQRDTMNKSINFASSMLIPELRKRIRVHEGGGSHRFAGFMVLKAPDVPSVLFETGYLSNLADSNFLASEDGREKISEAVRAAVNVYFDAQEK